MPLLDRSGRPQSIANGWFEPWNKPSVGNVCCLPPTFGCSPTEVRFGLTRLGTDAQPELLPVAAIVRHGREKQSAGARSIAIRTGSRFNAPSTLGLDTLQIPTLGYALFFPRKNENSSACWSFELSTPEPITFCFSFDLHGGGASSASLRGQENYLRH